MSGAVKYTAYFALLIIVVKTEDEVISSIILSDMISNH